MNKSSLQVATKGSFKPIITGVITFCLVVFTIQLPAEEWALFPAAPLEDALRVLPDPDGLVKVVIGTNGRPASESATVTLNPFWSADGKQFDVHLQKAGDKDDGKSVKVAPGQPIVIKAQGIPEGQLVWGSLSAKIGGEQLALPLILGSFGPAIVNGNEVSIPASGQGRLSIDISQHHPFDGSAHFTFTPFRSNQHAAKVGFTKTEADVSGEQRVVTFPDGQNIINLEIDASSLLPEVSYTGALRTTIGNRSFIDTTIKMTREKWVANASFSPINPARGENSVRLFLSAAVAQPIFGVTVSTDKEPTADFDPNNDLDVSLKRESDMVSLWTLDTRDAEQVASRSLQPGSRHEVVVKTNRALTAGTYATTLRFGALNVDPEQWVDAKVTFVVQHPPLFAIAILVAAVLVSYTTGKGLGIALRRRNLRRRIAAIRRTSWLRNDRWGALPIVRAFGRVAMADLALQHKHGLRRLVRVVTTPDLIADEITEVEKRLKYLERLDKLAIYWKTAPTASGAKVSDVDPMVVRRAQKILRGLVDRFSQLREGEEVGTAINSEIEALESWALREYMEAGYWTSLRIDVQLLLDSVQLEQFDFDKIILRQLEDELHNAESNVTDDVLKQALASALAGTKVAQTEGVQDIRDILTPVLESAYAGNIEQKLTTLENSEREVVRRLQRTIASPNVPGSLNAMIRLEGVYALLKLIWEQRENEERRKRFIKLVLEEKPLDQAFKVLDDEVWELLKKEDAVHIVPPGEGKVIEEYDPIDFEVICTDPDANTFLFKHGLEYEWRIDFGGDRPLTPITSTTMVTQFIPTATKNTDNKVTVNLTMKFKNEERPVKAVEFDTIATTQFRHLWPIPTTELIGIGLSLILALVAGFESDAFVAALAGSWNEYLVLFAWGIGADQMRNLIQNLDTFTKGTDAPVT